MNEKKILKVTVTDVVNNKSYSSECEYVKAVEGEQVATLAKEIRDRHKLYKGDCNTSKEIL